MSICVYMGSRSEFFLAAGSASSSRHASVSMPSKPNLRGSRASSLPMPVDVSGGEGNWTVGG